MSHADREAIRQLKHEYCFRVDDGDYAEWAALFTADGEFNSSQGGVYEGPEEIEQFATEEFEPAFEQTAHVVTNSVIDVDGDEATGRWYLLLFYESPEGETGWIQTTYRDEYRKVDGEWLIARTNSTAGIES